MKNIIIATVIALLFIGGGYYFSRTKTADDASSEMLLSASFACADGTHFIAEFPDAASVRILVDGEVTRTLPKTEGAGQRYEDGMYAYVFAGEGVSVTDLASGVMTTCAQPLDPNNAPVNFGDAGEGAGQEQDIAAAVSANIVGSWQSTEDAKFTRVFNNDGTTADLYDGEAVSEGTWRTFTSVNAPDTSFPIAEGIVYLAIETTDAETLYFSLGALTPERLELTYLDRGNLLTFTRI